MSVMGDKSVEIYSFLYVILTVVTKLFAFTNFIPSSTKLKTSMGDMMFNNTSLNRSYLTAVGDSTGGGA